MSIITFFDYFFFYRFVYYDFVLLTVPGTCEFRLSAECHSYPVPRALFNSKCMYAKFRSLSLDAHPLRIHFKRFYQTTTGYVLTMLSRNDGRSNVPPPPPLTPLHREIDIYYYYYYFLALFSFVFFH